MAKTTWTIVRGGLRVRAAFVAAIVLAAGVGTLSGCYYYGPPYGYAAYGAYPAYPCYGPYPYGYYYGYGYPFFGFRFGYYGYGGHYGYGGYWGHGGGFGHGHH
jgi:hypothetical protein